jgi:hypothetical protein
MLIELGTTRDRLAENPDGEEYAALVARQDELRREAREVMPTTKEALRFELERRVGAWDRIQEQGIDPVKQAGDGSAGGDFGFAADVPA